MTWRDYAQGAYRMRGIGRGQTIRMLVIPEVKGLVRESKQLCGQGDATDATFFAVELLLAQVVVIQVADTAEVRTKT